jgi:hypothetical protein
MWRRKQQHPDPDPEVEEARRRLVQAQRDLAATKRDNGKVDEVTRRMQQMRRANRFADLMRHALGGS